MARTLTRLLPYLKEATSSAETELTATDPLLLAGDLNASASALEALAQHPSYQVRVAVALNPHTPNHVHELLRADKSARVRNAAGGTLPAHLAIKYAGVSGILSVAGPRHYWTSTPEYDAAVAAYGQDIVDDRMLRNASTWDEVIDYVLNRRNNYDSQAAVAHYCRVHGEVLRGLQESLQDRGTGEGWMLRQLNAAITLDPAQLELYVADTDTDVLTQALLNPLCTARMTMGALRRGVLPLKTVSHILLVRVLTDPNGEEVLTSLLDLKVEVAAAAVLSTPDFPERFSDKAMTTAIRSREPWIREIAAIHPGLHHEARRVLARDNDSRVRERLAQRDDLDMNTALDLITFAVDSNAGVPFEVIRYIPDEHLGDLPWKVLTYPRTSSLHDGDMRRIGQILPAEDEGISRVTRYAADRIDSLPPSAFHTISALDDEFNGTINQMLVAALL